MSKLAWLIREKSKQGNPGDELTFVVETALRAMDLVMDDRPQDAQKLLDGGASSYHKVRPRGSRAMARSTSKAIGSQLA